MKNFQPFLKSLSILIVCLGIYSCETEEMDVVQEEPISEDSISEEADNETISEEDAVNVVAHLLTEEEGSMDDTLEGIFAAFFEALLEAELCTDGPVTKDFGEGPNQDAGYHGSVTYDVECAGPIPLSGYLMAETEKGLANPNTGLVRTNSTQLEGEIAATFQPLGAAMSGMYISNNTIGLEKDGEVESFESTLELQLQDLAIDALNLKVLSGFGTLNFKTKNTIGEEVSFEGSIEFHGDRTITLKLGDEVKVLDFSHLDQDAAQEQFKMSVSKEQAGQLVMKTMQENTGGVNDDIEEIIQSIVKVLTEADLCTDEPVVDEYGATFSENDISYGQSGFVTYDVTCIGPFPISGKLMAEKESFYFSPVLSTSITAAFDGEIAATIDPLGVTMGGGYSADLDIAAITEDDKLIWLESTFVMQLDELTINTDLQEISVVALGTVSFEVQTSTDGDYSFEGSIEITEDGKAIFKFQDFEHIVDLNKPNA